MFTGATNWVHFKRECLTIVVLALVASAGCNRIPPASAALPPVVVSKNAGSVTLETSMARFEILASGYVRASLRGSTDLSLDDLQASPSDYIEIEGRQIKDFTLDLDRVTISDTTGNMGKRGKRVELQGKSTSATVEKRFVVEIYEDLPTVAFTTAFYRNTGRSVLRLDRAIAQRHILSATLVDPTVKPYDMWSFSGASEAWGRDDVMQVGPTFSRANIMQQVMRNDTNMTGGGVPVVAFWTRSIGEAVGHAELLPLRLSIPAHALPDGRVETFISIDGQPRFAPDDVFSTPLTFRAVYRGDFYEPLRLYASALQQKGWSLAQPNDSDYEVNWCGWGYRMDFTPKQMISTLPKLHQLGINWATLDAGWFANRGDWEPRPDTFPGTSIKDVADEYHRQNVRVTLWWIPIVAEDGAGKDILNNQAYRVSRVVREHPDWLILDKNGKPARAAADLAALCPALPEVQQYHKQLTEKFVREWGYDGHKLDFSYTVPACYNPKHHHRSPSDSTNAMGEIYKIIFQTTRALKPHSVIQACPCGTPPNVAWLPFIDQAVTADPVGARQVRLRTKMYKALLGPAAAIYGDHVELSEVGQIKGQPDYDIGRDFASSLGTGAVLGTKFTWPDYGPDFQKVTLTTDKQALWQKWIDLYKAKMLSRGDFKNLYTYGYDRPEGYAIAKDGKMYYAFFASAPHAAWTGSLELRGLEPGHYRVVDYVDGTELGTLDAADPWLRDINFHENLLLEVSRAAK